MGQGNEVVIGRRYGQLAGLAAFVLVLGRLGRLLQTGPTSPRWQLILIAAAFLGGVVRWLIRQMATTRWVAIALFGLGNAIAVRGHLRRPGTSTGPNLLASGNP